LKKNQISVVTRDEVGAYKPYLWEQSTFYNGVLFREWILTKIVNGERASYSAPKFARMQERTRSQMLEDIVANLQNHAETGQIPKPYRLVRMLPADDSGGLFRLMFGRNEMKKMHPWRLISEKRNNPADASGGLLFFCSGRIEKRKMRPKRIICEMNPPEENSGRNYRNIFVFFRRRLDLWNARRDLISIRRSCSFRNRSRRLNSSSCSLESVRQMASVVNFEWKTTCLTAEMDGFGTWVGSDCWPMQK
jgi:Rap/ran-GAP